MFERNLAQILQIRLKEKRRFIQVILGPRQVGKTTAAIQVIEMIDSASHYASADEPTLRDTIWLEQQWNIARIQLKQKKLKEVILVLDEIQKITQWSETVKKLWDEDTRLKINIKVVLLGSSSLIIQDGLTETLAGRFEIIPATHWSFEEMSKAFHWNLKQYIYFGGYPGSAHLINDEARWQNYIKNALIETTISRDILLITPIHKPALLRRLFHLGCQYSGQILSFQKMVGQLQDAGNTTTLAHYLDLLDSAGMLAGIQKFAGQTIRQRSSSPKLQVFNNALISAQNTMSYDEATNNPEYWGRLVESAIGAHLLNNARKTTVDIFYWREHNQEVDFVLQKGRKLIAIEVKSGQHKIVTSGMKAFQNTFKPQKVLLVGNQGISIKDFLSTSIEDLFD